MAMTGRRLKCTLRITTYSPRFMSLVNVLTLMKRDKKLKQLPKALSCYNTAISRMALIGCRPLSASLSISSSLTKATMSGLATIVAQSTHGATRLSMRARTPTTGHGPGPRWASMMTQQTLDLSNRSLALRRSFTLDTRKERFKCSTVWRILKNNSTLTTYTK